MKTLFLAKNGITTIEDNALAEFDDLTVLYVPDNRLTSVSPDVFDVNTRQHIIYIDISRNELGDLRFIIDSLADGTRPDFSVLFYLHVAFNLIDEIRPFTFQSAPHLSSLDVYGNKVLTIRSNAFNGVGVNDLYHIHGLRMTSIVLRGLGIDTIEAYAFNHSNVPELDLRLNNLASVSSSSFSGMLNIAESECVDFENWYMVSTRGNGDADGVITCNASEFSDALETNFLIIQEGSTMGSGGYTMVEACCGAGGGYREGKALLVDKFSTVTCEVSGTNVLCGCGDTNRRYDLERRTCVPFCSSGSFWNASSHDAVEEHFMLKTKFGTCIECPAGRRAYEMNEDEDVNDGFPSQCTLCRTGKFSDREETIVCKDCPSGRFAGEMGMTACLECPSGTFQRPTDAIEQRQNRLCSTSTQFAPRTCASQERTASRS